MPELYTALSLIVVSVVGVSEDSMVGISVISVVGVSMIGQRESEHCSPNLGSTISSCTCESSGLLTVQFLRTRVFQKAHL